MAHKICHFEIPADDMEKLKEFYEKSFGWKIEPRGGMEGYYIINTGDENLGGGMMKRQTPEHQPTNYIEVEDIDSYIKKVEENGAKVVVPKTPIPGMGWFANVIDPQGNLFGMYQDDQEAK